MNEVVSDEEEIRKEALTHRKLLDIARKSVEAAVRGVPAPEFTVTDPELYHHHGAFVTIRTHGALRGCIGRFVSDIPLYQLVREMAVAAAVEDPRFRDEPLKETELPGIDIEVSIISSLRRISDPLNFEPGRHGVYVKKGDKAGCLLPQVAVEKGWSKEEFLSCCCTEKAGLDPDAWKDADTEVYVFTAGIVSEHN